MYNQKVSPKPTFPFESDTTVGYLVNAAVHHDIEDFDRIIFLCLPLIFLSIPIIEIMNTKLLKNSKTLSKVK
jgi:hypothetical protein